MFVSSRRFSGFASMTWGYDDSLVWIVVKERQSRIFRAHLPCRQIFLHVVFAKQPFEDVIIDIPAALRQRRARSIGPMEVFGELFPWLLFEIIADRTEEKGQREPALCTGKILEDFFNAIPTETWSNALDAKPAEIATGVIDEQKFIGQGSRRWGTECSARWRNAHRFSQAPESREKTNPEVFQESDLPSRDKIP